jgi:hypothetical protein
MTMTETIKNKSIPKPPQRRPTVMERISMLQMAQTDHTGLVPNGGVRLVLPALPETDTEPLVGTTSGNSYSNNAKPRKRPGYFPWRRSAANFSLKPKVITVRLLDESEW